MNDIKDLENILKGIFGEDGIEIEIEDEDEIENQLNNLLTNEDKELILRTIHKIIKNHTENLPPEAFLSVIARFLADESDKILSAREKHACEALKASKVKHEALNKFMDMFDNLNEDEQDALYQYFGEYFNCSTSHSESEDENA